MPSEQVRVAVDVVRHDGAYLIARRSPETEYAGTWEFVGGKVEADESVEEAARRELREETGLEGTVIRRGDPYISAVDDRYHLIPLLIEAASRDVTMGREHDAYAWIALDELDTYDTLGQEQSLVNLDLR